MKQAPALEIDIEDDGSESLDAAKDVLSAVKKGDPKALDMALQRHYTLCAEEHHGEESEEEEEPAESRRY